MPLIRKSKHKRLVPVSSASAITIDIKSIAYLLKMLVYKILSGLFGGRDFIVAQGS